jgi:hypothetical protein
MADDGHWGSAPESLARAWLQAGAQGGDAGHKLGAHHIQAGLAEQLKDSASRDFGCPATLLDPLLR